MKTLTVKVPEELDTRLVALAAERGESKSAVIRTALEQIVENNGVSGANSCWSLARDIAGSVEGPEDLSHNKLYIKGYGR